LSIVYYLKTLVLCLKWEGNSELSCFLRARRGKIKKTTQFHEKI
jgi:hypothetical protein